MLTSHTQVALVYGYQGFDFSVARNGISFPRDSGNVRAPDLRTDGFAAGGGAADHQDRNGMHDWWMLYRRSTVLGEPKREPVGSIPIRGLGRGPGAVALQVYENVAGSYLSTLRDQRVGDFCGGAERHRATGCGSTAVAGVERVHRYRIFAQRPVAEFKRGCKLATCVPQNQANPDNLPVCPGVDANTFSSWFCGRRGAPRVWTRLPRLCELPVQSSWRLIIRTAEGFRPATGFRTGMW